MNDNIEELLGALYIQSLRIYDVLMLLAAKNGVDTDILEEMHANGKVFCPDPALVLDDDETQSSN